MPCITLSSGKTVCFGNETTYNHGGIVLESNLGYKDSRYPDGGQTPAFERTTDTVNVNSGNNKKLDRVMPWEAPLKPGAWGGLDMRGMRSVTPNQQEAMNYATQNAQANKIGKFYMDGTNYRLSNSADLDKQRVANSDTTMGAMYNMEKNVDQNSPVLQGIRQGGKDAAILLGGTVGAALAAPAMVGTMSGALTGLAEAPSLGNAANAAWKGYELYGATKYGTKTLGDIAHGDYEHAGLHALEGVGYALGAKHASVPIMAGINGITEGVKHYNETGNLSESLSRGALAGGANMLLGNAAHNLHLNHAVGDAASKYPTNSLAESAFTGPKGNISNNDKLESTVDSNTPYLAQLPQNIKLDGGLNKSKTSNTMDTNKLKAQLAAMQEEINRTAEQYGLGGHLQHMMNGGEIQQLPVAPYGFAKDGNKNNTSHTNNRPGTRPSSPMLDHEVSDFYRLMQVSPTEWARGKNWYYSSEANEMKNMPGYTTGTPVVVNPGPGNPNDGTLPGRYIAPGHENDNFWPGAQYGTMPVDPRFLQGTPPQRVPVKHGPAPRRGMEEILPLSPLNPGLLQNNFDRSSLNMGGSGQPVASGDLNTFDQELPNTGAMMMNDRATGGAYPQVDDSRLRTLDDLPARPASAPAQLLPIEKSQLVNPYDGLTMMEYFRAQGLDPSFANRQRLFSQIVPDYKGTADQNNELMRKIRNGEIDLHKLNNTTGGNKKGSGQTKPVEKMPWDGDHNDETLRDFRKPKTGTQPSPQPTPVKGVKKEFGKPMTEDEVRAMEQRVGWSTGKVDPFHAERFAILGNPLGSAAASTAYGTVGRTVLPAAERALLPSAERIALPAAERFALPSAERMMLGTGKNGAQMVIPFEQGGEAAKYSDMYYAGGNIPSHPEIMHLYGFEDGGQTMELPVAPYGYNAEGGKDTEGTTKGSSMNTGLSSAQIASLATHYFSQDPSMGSGVPAMIGERRLSDNERMLIQEGMKQLSNSYKQGQMRALSPEMIDQLRSSVSPLKQAMGGMNYEDGGQLPMDIAVARFKAAAKDKGLSGGEAMAYVEKMKSKYNYQAGGAVKESDISQYDLAQYGNGGIMHDGNKFPGYNKAIATPPGDKHKKMMILKKGGKVKLVKFGHR